MTRQGGSDRRRWSGGGGWRLAADHTPSHGSQRGGSGKIGPRRHERGHRGGGAAGGDGLGGLGGVRVVRPRTVGTRPPAPPHPAPPHPTPGGGAHEPTPALRPAGRPPPTGAPALGGAVLAGAAAGRGEWSGSGGVIVRLTSPTSSVASERSTGSAGASRGACERRDAAGAVDRATSSLGRGGGGQRHAATQTMERTVRAGTPRWPQRRARRPRRAGAVADGG